jgi:hypothetical protein
MPDNLGKAPQPRPETATYAISGFATSLNPAASTAASDAVTRAHAASLAVPGMIDGKALEYRPDGKIAPIPDLITWSPTDWKGRA